MATNNKLNSTLIDFISNQHLFFVATAAEDGRVNLSPKGCDCLKIIDENTLIWLNLSGSGNETAAHLRQSNRMTLMFCAFTGPAMILRLYGQAKTFHPRDEQWPLLLKQFPQMAGSRQVFELTIDLIQTSCGTGVPELEFISQRADEQLLPFYNDMGPDGVSNYWERKNSVSIDGKPTGIFDGI